MQTDTKFWTKTLLNPFVHKHTGQLTNTSLFILGIIAGLLHVHLRYPLSIPGHHGLEWMALVMFGRCLSTHRFAASIIAVGAASGYLVQTPFLALAHEIKPAFIFLLSGFFADLFYRLLKYKMLLIIRSTIAGGLAFLTKPAVMYVLFLFTGMKVGMFIKHPDHLPFISHFVFGAIGAASGAILAKLANIKTTNDRK